MSLAQFIRDNTNDGRDIASVLIDVLNDRIDGCKLSHRLTAARLLTIYGYEDAPDFIAKIAAPGRERRDKQWMTIDPACKDPECEVHGESPEIDFDPNDFHY